jgi:hypothetical protein
MDKREEIVKGMISTSLHIKYENSSAYSKDELLRDAIAIKDAISPLYSVTDRQWQNILADIASYADCLVVERKVSDYEKDYPIFEVVVKKPGECSLYSCFNKNITQRDDFINRRVYDVKIINARPIVYCY